MQASKTHRPESTDCRGDPAAGGSGQSSGVPGWLRLLSSGVPGSGVPGSGVPGFRACTRSPTPPPLPTPATPVGQAVALAPRTALPSPTPPPPPDATHRSQPRRPQRPHRPRRRPQGEGISEEIDVATPGRSRRKKATNRHNPGCSQPCHHIGWHTPQQTGRSRMLGRFALITLNDFAG